MKRIYLVRHAKSSWDDVLLTDFERPLNPRGRKDAPKIGESLASKGIKPEAVFSSPANRALTTARFVCEKLGFPLAEIKVREAIYDALLPDLMKFIHSIDDSYNTVMIFGHNPSFTSLSEALTGFDLDNLPTCGVFALEAGIESWKDIKEGEGYRMILYEYPKMI